MRSRITLHPTMSLLSRQDFTIVKAEGYDASHASVNEGRTPEDCESDGAAVAASAMPGRSVGRNSDNGE